MSVVRRPKTPLTPSSLRECELYGVLLKAVGEPAAFSDECLQSKLFAAEDAYEKELGIVLGERRVFSDAQRRVGHRIPALRLDDFDPSTDISEAAYDYPRELWDNERWAGTKLRRRPLREIHRVIFTWAGSDHVWTVPREWVVTDRRGGTFNITPSSGPAVLISFSAYLMTVLAGGRGLPHSIYVDYSVGLTADELCTDHYDLLEGIRLWALLSVYGPIGNIISFGGMGQSLSLDGLSHSRSFGGRWGAYSGVIELAMERERQIRQLLKDRFKGVPVVFTT